MGELKQIKINNSKDAAADGKWSNPGASLYDACMDAFYCEGNIPTDSRDLVDAMKSGKYKQWFNFLEEAYLVAPIKNIKNSPYGRTPFSRSGCKYPHHVIRGGEMVLSIPGVKAAYSRACQMHDNKGEVKEHLERHMNELGIKYHEESGTVYFDEEIDLMEAMEANFDDIESFLVERSHGRLKYDFRLGWSYDTGHQIKIVYSLDGVNIDSVGDFYWAHNPDNKKPDGSYKMDGNQYLDYVRKNIRKVGNNDHKSSGQKVLAIVDMVDNTKLNSVKLIPPFVADSTENPTSGIHLSRNKQWSKAELKAVQDRMKSMPLMPQIVVVGTIDKAASYKATSFGKNTTNRNTGIDYRFNQLAKKEFLKDGRGAKMHDILPEDIRVFGYTGKGPVMYGNPNKRNALTYLHALDVDHYNMLKSIANALKSRSYPNGWDFESTYDLYQHVRAEIDIIRRDIKSIEAGNYDIRMMDKYLKRDSNFNGIRRNRRFTENTDYLVPLDFESLWFIADRELIEHMMIPSYEDTGESVDDIFEWMDAVLNGEPFEENTSVKGSIRIVHRKDVDNNKYFIDWFFKNDDWSMMSPEMFDFDLLSTMPERKRWVYGYFIDNRIEGIVVIHYIKNGNYYTVRLLYVNKKYQNNKEFRVGTKLMKHVVNKYGSNEMRLKVYDYNKRALHLYEKFGFIKTSSGICDDKDEGHLYGKRFHIMKRVPTDIKESYWCNNLFAEESESDKEIQYLDKDGDADNKQHTQAKDQSSSHEFVPVYGLCKCYSKSQFRNDGVTPKSQTELNSVKFHKILKKLTRGDNYSHALVSFDLSLEHCYSYGDEGFEVDSIIANDTFLGTESVYICVMFVSKEDKSRMKKFVQYLLNHRDETRYASANLLKAYVATPYKVDKRFVCSSFTGYIMGMANPKNLHRDYSRMRPEDITIIPRAFYLANIKDRDDFIARKSELEKRVKTIYKEHYDEIDDWNNHLPKLMLQDRVDKLKTIDKIFDWIIDRL